MKNILFGILLLMPLVVYAELQAVVVQGLGGNDEYTEQFSEQVEVIGSTMEQLTAKNNVTVFIENASRKNILEFFSSLNKSMSKDDRLIVFLIGHGSYDGQEYKFNIPGPDLTNDDLLSMLDNNAADNQLLINTSSSSGALLKELRNDSRIIISATKSEGERNAPRFGTFFVDALDNSSADINKNNYISAQEAFEYASREVKDFYESSGQLATEHPQLEGKRAAQFNLAKIDKKQFESADPVLKGLLSQRDRLDQQIQELQLRKDGMASSDYLEQLQTLILELSMLQERIDTLEQDN